MEPSDYAVVKRAADRAILPVAAEMIAAAALVATATFVGVLWARGSQLPDWAYDATTLLPEPLVALALLLVYLRGRRRVQRRVLAAANGERGYEVLAQAERRGALRRYNLTAALLGIALLVACVFYLSYLATMLYQEADDREDASPTKTRAIAPESYLPGSYPPMSYLPESYLPGSYLLRSYMPVSCMPAWDAPRSYVPGSGHPAAGSGAPAMGARCVQPPRPSSSVQRSSVCISSVSISA